MAHFDIDISDDACFSALHPGDTFRLLDRRQLSAGLFAAAGAFLELRRVYLVISRRNALGFGFTGTFSLLGDDQALIDEVML
jgi:hypothetical protein